MIKALRVTVLLDALVVLAAFPLIAQVYQTGPAGLAQQMPHIYAPYMANISRVRILENKDKLNTPYRGGVSVPGGRVPSGRPHSCRGIWPRSWGKHPRTAGTSKTYSPSV